MEDKIEQQESVKALKVGAKDSFGNTIIQVLSAGDEFAIYEIDKPDLADRLRVHIDGSTNEREHELAERFTRVKQKYIEAKGLLYRSANLGIMKSRVAHALSAVLASDQVDGNKEFEELIQKINAEYRQVTVSRIFYLLPTIILTIAVAMQAFYLVWSKQTGDPLWHVTCVLLGSCLGGSLSIFSGLKKYKFEEYSKSAFYLMFGMERVLLACIAGAVAYVVLQSGVINVDKIAIKNDWNVILISIMAGFSESLVPSIIEKVSENVSKKKPD
ncbi:MAG: hypothetical protein WCL42_02810 [Chlorobiaceae bacterium]|jgi:hypothetical protein